VGSQWEGPHIAQRPQRFLAWQNQPRRSFPDKFRGGLGCRTVQPRDAAAEGAMSLVAAGATLVAKASGVLSWLPWALAGASLIAGAGGTLWYRSQYESCLAAGAKALADQIETDKVENAKAVAALNEQLRTGENKVVTGAERIYAAPITRDCAQSPAMRAASDGLRQLFSGGQADDRRQPAAAVPGPAAGAGGGKRQ